MQKRIFILLFTALLAVSCGTTKQNATQGTMNDPAIIKISWKLAVLEGRTIPSAPNQEESIHFVLREDGKVTGFTGCNTFGGAYTLEKGNRIRFDQMLATMRACPDVEVDESEFLKVFELADNYTVNGDTLMLNIGRRAPLAVFEAVYF